MTEQKKPGMAFWATVVVVVVLVYPASFGPACWLVERGTLPISGTATVYRPVLWMAICGKPDAARRAVLWYGSLATRPPLDPILWQMAVDAHAIRSTYRPLIRR
jgi:hypothetical protein